MIKKAKVSNEAEVLADFLMDTLSAYIDDETRDTELNSIDVIQGVARFTCDVYASIKNVDATND